MIDIFVDWYVSQYSYLYHVVLVSNPSDRTFDAFPVQSQNRYFVENIYEALDVPGGMIIIVHLFTSN